MSTTTLQPDAPLASLSPEDAQLLDALLLARFDLHALVERFQLTASRLLDWAASPAIQARLKRLQEFADQCFELRAATARANAADALDRVATGRDAVESRRAASALIRVRAARPAPKAAPQEPPPAAPPQPAPSLPDIPGPGSHRHKPPLPQLLKAASAFDSIRAAPPPFASFTEALAAAAGTPRPLGDHTRSPPRARGEPSAAAA